MEHNLKFERLLDLEDKAMSAKLSTRYAELPANEWGGKLAVGRKTYEKRTQEALFMALDELTEEERKSYGEYRKAWRNGIIEGN